VKGADVVVVSSAVAQDNPELLAARENRIPVVPRAEMLGELMRFRYSIAVAGTHGKTTTTSLVASILAEGGKDPTFVIGGRLKSADSNARLGAGQYLVAEADESDASFTHLQPLIAIVTNIDNDHLVTHAGNFESLKQSFVEFLHNLPFYGLAVVCSDDQHVRSILARIGRPVVTYGLSEGVDLRAVNIRPRGLQTDFQVVRSGGAPFDVTVNVPGTHNVLNSLAAIAVGLELGIDEKAIGRALSLFQGVDRRLQHIADVDTPVGRITIVDDYGHHPTEVAATLQALRQGYAGRRIVLAFQPHRYTRTRSIGRDFADAFKGAAEVVVTEVYPAGEEPIPGVSGRIVAQAVADAHPELPVHYAARRSDLADVPARLARAGDLVLTLGAGDLTTLPDVWLAH